MPRKPRPSYGRVVTHEASRCVFGRVAATLSRLAAADRVVTGHNTIPPPPRPFRNQRRTRGIAGSGREPNLCCDIVSRFRVFYVEARRRDQNRSAVFHTTYGALGRRRAFGTFFAFFPSDGSVLFMFVFARDDLKKKKKNTGNRVNRGANPPLSSSPPFRPVIVFPLARTSGPTSRHSHASVTFFVPDA